MNDRLEDFDKGYDAGYAAAKQDAARAAAPAENEQGGDQAEPPPERCNHIHCRERRAAALVGETDDETYFRRHGHEPYCPADYIIPEGPCECRAAAGPAQSGPSGSAPEPPAPDRAGLREAACDLRRIAKHISTRMYFQEPITPPHAEDIRHDDYDRLHEIAALLDSGGLDVERLRCGWCGDDLLLTEIAGHLLSEGRTIPDAARLGETNDGG